MHIENNVMEGILNTLLINEKSKDTVKARQDLKRLGIRRGLWLGQNKNEKCSKPQAAYSFTSKDRKKFSQSKLIDILYNLELIYPPTFFDIMIHLVIYLHLEAIDGGPIRPWWMYPFERFLKKLNNYVRNKAKQEGSIAKGYVTEEALTFSSHCFRDVTTKHNRLEHNVDCPPPTYGHSIDVDAPPDIIDVVEDDDIINEEDPIPHDLADSDDEVLVNLDINDGVNMLADVAWGNGGNGGDDDHPLPYQIPTGCEGCLGKGTRKPNLGGRRAGRMHTCQVTRNLGLKAITDKNDPVLILFDFGDKETLIPLGDHAAHWANYLGELVRELPLHYPSWHQMPPERKAGVVAKIGTQFDLRTHMESDH
nr:hypothetical protein [Tanacetum cinerariifolium]